MKKKTVLVTCIVAAVLALIIAPFAAVWLASEWRYARVQKLMGAEHSESELSTPTLQAGSPALPTAI